MIFPESRSRCISAHIHLLAVVYIIHMNVFMMLLPNIVYNALAKF